MAFSSVRENVNPSTKLEMCWNMLLFIICFSLILIYFIFILFYFIDITDVFVIL